MCIFKEFKSNHLKTHILLSMLRNSGIVSSQASLQDMNNHSSLFELIDQ